MVVLEKVSLSKTKMPTGKAETKQPKKTPQSKTFKREGIVKTDQPDSTSSEARTAINKTTNLGSEKTSALSGRKVEAKEGQRLAPRYQSKNLGEAGTTSEKNVTGQRKEDLESEYLTNPEKPQDTGYDDDGYIAPDQAQDSDYLEPTEQEGIYEEIDKESGYERLKSKQSETYEEIGPEAGYERINKDDDYLEPTTTKKESSYLEPTKLQEESGYLEPSQAASQEDVDEYDDIPLEYDDVATQSKSDKLAQQNKVEEPDLDSLDEDVYADIDDGSDTEEEHIYESIDDQKMDQANTKKKDVSSKPQTIGRKALQRGRTAVKKLFKA